jgi:hypothetical protein
MNAPFLLPGLDSSKPSDRPPPVPAQAASAAQSVSHHEAELAAELASLLRRRKSDRRDHHGSKPRPVAVRRDVTPDNTAGDTLKERLDAVDWRDGRNLPAAPSVESDMSDQIDIELDENVPIATSAAETAPWLRKARRDRQLARISHAVSWVVTLLIGGGVFAAASIMLFGPGRVMAALNKLPLM